MAEPVDFSRAFKFRGERKYFNISVIWIFYYPLAIRLFYYLHFNPITVLSLAIILGLASAVFILKGNLIVAAVLLHLRDVCDASDGSLARVTGKVSRIGRFMDSLGDMLVLTCIIAVITYRGYAHANQAPYFYLGILTWFSLFLQCSYFNYYQLKYGEALEKKNLVAQSDESGVDRRESGFLRLLHYIYLALYGWQDIAVRNIDRLSTRILQSYPAFDRYEWYTDKLFLTLNSPLCFGTHIFLFVICLLAGNPELSLTIIAFAFNLYFLILMAGRLMYYKFHLTGRKIRK